MKKAKKITKKTGTRRPAAKAKEKKPEKNVNPAVAAVFERIERAKETKAKPAAGEPAFEVKKTKIRIVGIGGGGGNIVSEIAARIKKASFLAANTDFNALEACGDNVSTFQFGKKFTQGLGAGMDAFLGEEAAKDEKENIKKLLEGQDLVVIVASLGGGTGSGAAPVFAQISKSLGNLTYGIFTMPFVFEGSKKNEIARAALERVKPYLNALTILPNERVFRVVPKTTPFLKTLSYINKMLSDSLEGLIETIFEPGLINIDFADLRTILSGQGKIAFLNTTELRKDGAGNESFDANFSSPLYPYGIEKARGILLNISGESNLKLSEVNQILTSMQSKIHRDAKIIFGVSPDGGKGKTLKVTILATGCVYELDDESFAGDKKGPQKEAIVEEKKANRAKKSGKKKKSTNKPAHKPAQAAKTESVKVPPAEAKESPKVDLAESKAADDKVKIAVAQTKTAPLTAETAEAATVRKNAVQVKQAMADEEKEMLEKEKAWEMPAFLRKRPKNN